MSNVNWKNVPTRTIDVGGVPFAYRELGPDSGVPVIFLHHLMAVLDDWDPRVIDGIAAQRRVIAFDNRGVGASGGAVPHTIEEMGHDAIAFIRALGHTKVDLLGFSLGGGVAQMVALQSPDLVRRMVLAGTGPRGGGGIDEINRIAVIAYLKSALTLSDPRNFLFFPRTPVGKRAAKDYLSRLKERTKDRDKGISLQARGAQLKAIRTAGMSAPDDLSLITQPVFVANGDRDLMVDSRHSANMARRLPNAQLTIYPDSGHGGVFQHHRAFVPAVLDFLADWATMKTDLLNQPLTLANGTVLRNRLAKAAMSETLATYDNRPTPDLVRLYRRWGSSGLGMILTGNVMIDRRALGEPGNVAIEDETDLPVLRQWAQAATEQGAAIWVQLNHPGKQSAKGLNAYNLAPSAVPFREDMATLFETPREATTSEIQDIIGRFGRSAAICKKAGFTGVQIHGAHGYLVSQFLSPHHNRRSDEWGGSSENRRRFVLAVYAEIRRQVGPDFPVAIKLNSTDFQRGGFTEEESLETIRALADAGIDLIEISGGTYEAPGMGVNMQEPKKASTLAREAYFLEFAEKVRAAVKVPLMVTGGFRTAAGMNAALRSGALDVVGLARLLAIDPDAPSALLQGRDSPQQVRPIITGIKAVDRMGVMEVWWYERQLKRIAKGKSPRPDESGLSAFLKAALTGGWGTFRTRRLRASN